MIIKNRKGICLKCNSFAQYGIDMYGNNFLEKYWDYDKNKNLDPWVISRSSRTAVFIKCQENIHHESYKIMCNTFVNVFPNSGCPYCNVRGVKGKPCVEDSLGALFPKSIDLWGSNNNLTPFEVTPLSHKKAWWKCPHGKHEDYLRVVSETVRYDFRCPSCVDEDRFSALQKKVSDYLSTELGYEVRHEYDCNIIPQSLKKYRNHKMPYDNEIVDLKLIIEVHGKQHYIPCSWHTLTAERNNTTADIEFQLQKERDLCKKNYAIDNGYHYLEIPYLLEENDAYKQIILDKIYQINKNL